MTYFITIRIIKYKMWIRLFLLNNNYIIYIYNCSDRIYITTYGGLTSHGYTMNVTSTAPPSTQLWWSVKIRWEALLQALQGRWYTIFYIWIYNNYIKLPCCSYLGASLISWLVLTLLDWLRSNQRSRGTLHGHFHGMPELSNESQVECGDVYVKKEYHTSNQHLT